MVETSIRNSFDLDYEILTKQITSSKILFEKFQANPNKKGRSKQDDLANLENYIKKIKDDYFNDQNSLFNRCNDQRKVKVKL